MLNQSGLETPPLHLPRLAAWSSLLLAASLGVGPASFAQPGLALWFAEGDAVLKARTADGELQVAFAEGSPVRAVAVDDAAGRVWFYAGGFLHAVATDGSPRMTITVPTADDPRVAIDLNDADGTVWLGVGSQLWRYSSSGTELATVALPSSVRALEVDPGRQAVWAATETGLRAFDLVSGSPVDWWFPLPGGGPPTMDVSLSAETGWIYEIGDGNIKRLLPDPDFGWTTVWFQVPAPDAHAVAARTDGAYFATPDTLHRISEDGVILWSVTPFPLEGGIIDLEVDPSDGSVWVAGSRQIAQVSDAGNVLRLFDFQTLIQIRDLDLSIDLVFDVTPPQITPVSPQPGSAVATASPTIQATFTDDTSGTDLSTVRLVLDGLDRTGESVVSESGVSLTPTSPLSEGEHRVEVIATDRSGNRAQLEWSFLVDTFPPTVAVVRPEQSVVVAETVPLFVAEYYDGNSGIDPSRVLVRFDAEEIEECAQDLAAVVCSPATLADGPHRFEVSVADSAGNLADTAFDFIFISDRLPPTIDISHPPVGLVTRDPHLTIEGSVADDSGIVALVRVDGRVVAVDNGTFRAQVLLDQGQNLFRVEAIDSTGKVGAHDVLAVLDLESPTLTLQAPSDGAVTNADAIDVLGRVSDGFGIQRVEVAGEPVVLEAGRFSRRVDLIAGLNQIVVRATDLAGNSSEASVEVEFFRLPEVTITSPTDLTTLATTATSVEGFITADVVAVSVNGSPAELIGETFRAEVPLIEGGNVLTATASDGTGRVATDSVNVVRDLTPPHIEVAEPRDGDRTIAETISVSGLINDIVAGTVNAGEVTVVVGGIEARVANRSFVADGVPLVAGENLISVRAIDRGGNLAEAFVRVERVASPGPRIAIVGGDRQSAVVGTTLPTPLLTEVRDAMGLPVAGVTVLFKVVRSDGVFANGLPAAAVETGSDGRAAIGFTLGTRAGVANQTVHALASGFGAPAVFRADAVPGDAALIVVDSGDHQTAAAGRALPRPLIAVVTDASFNRLPGVPVTFRVALGNGSFKDGTREWTVTTDSDGRAVATFLVGSDSGEGSDVVNAGIASLPTGPITTFTATARVAGRSENTTISGVVLDNTGEPVPGVTMRILGSVLTAVTDVEGVFRIAPAPVGTIKLIVDGSTTSRAGAWPDLEFVLTTVSGVDNTLGMPIYLLPLDLENGIHVSETQGGVIELPAIPGFALEIDPGSATLPGGSKSGLISVTAVHGDRVPMTPNFGQQPRLIVTIQPAGTRFDPPARLVLPNVEGLRPGSVTEMYSFDHDLGHFVSIGPATVSSDGTVIRSDPGVGVLKAGWHCGGNPSTTGTIHDCPTCQTCVNDRCAPDPTQDGATCDDGDACTAADTCSRGFCEGEPRKLRTVDAQANGQDAAAVAVDDEVQFEIVRVDHQHCDPLIYEWNFGDGNTGSGASTTHVFTQPGSYTTTATVFCGPCLRERQEDTVPVEVNEFEVEIVQPQAGARFDLDPTPDVADIDAQARITGLIPDPTAGTTFNWIVTLELNGIACRNGVNRQIANESLLENQVGGAYSPNFTTVRGGDLEMQVEATIGSRTDDASVDGIEVRGTNPQKSAIAARLPHDTLRRIACHESSMRQFDAGADGGTSKCPLFSGDRRGGVGIMQITNPAPSIEEHWDWRANVDRGSEIFESKAGFPGVYPGQLSTSQEFRDAINAFNQDRQSMGLPPIQAIVPPFTRGDYNSNLQQYELDHLRAYNGYAGRLFGLPHHEFAPQVDFRGILVLQIDPVAGTGTVIWEQVPAQARNQTFGDPNYVNNVLGLSPQCP